MLTKPYSIPAESLEHCYEVKKSRFITQVHYIKSREQAMTLLAQSKQQYPDARHHCWAYLLGNPRHPSTAAFNDDGEPSGTAGKPILNVLNHKHIGNIMVIVIRYFGGVKLGAGGLVRAYSAATQQAVEKLSISEYVPTAEIEMVCEFSHESDLRRLLAAIPAEIIRCDYQEDLKLLIQCPYGAIKKLHGFCGSRQGARVLSPYD